MTDLTALIARHKNCRPNAAENPAWANCEHDIGDLIAALEQLQAELLEYQQCLDAGIEHRIRRKAETEAESLRAELAAVKRDAERYRWLRDQKESIFYLFKAKDWRPYGANVDLVDFPQFDELDTAIDAAKRR